MAWSRCPQRIWHGREQNITITGSTNLSENEIQRAMADAAAYEEEDTRRRERLELHNQAEMLAYKVDEPSPSVKRSWTRTRRTESGTTLPACAAACARISPKR